MSGIPVRHINWLILKKLKMPSRIAAQKPLLTEKMKKKRLDWCKVMYSDCCLRSMRSRVQRPTGSNRFDSRYTVKTDKLSDSVVRYHSGGSLKLNACILILAHMVYL